MKTFLLMLLLFCTISSEAQLKYERTEIVTGGFINPFSYTKDSMVLPRSRNKLSFGDEFNADLQVCFALPNKRFRVTGGVGYSQRHFSMNKFNVGDFVLLVIPFAYKWDTAYLSRVRFTGQYINVPLGFECRLSATEKHRVTFFTGIRLISSIKIASSVDATADTNYFRPSVSQLNSIKDAYNNTLNSYLLRIEPYLDMDIYFVKGFGMRMGLFPLSFYATRWAQKLTIPPTALGANFTLYKKITGK